MPFDGVVTRAVVKELNKMITPGRINKIYQPTKTEALFTIRSNRRNVQLLFSIHPTYARFHLTDDRFENPKEPPMFCMVLRKYLAGGIVKNIEQDGMERIIRFHIETRNELGDLTTYQLIFELMGRHSHLMLVDERGIILDTMKHIPMSLNRHRTILPGAHYIPPPSQHKLHPLEITADDFIKKLDFNAGKLHMQIVHTVDGVSPFLAKEIVHQADLGSLESYRKAFITFQKQLKQNLYEPAIYHLTKEEFHVLKMTYVNAKKTAFESTNEMLDYYYSGRSERERVKQRARDLTRFIQNEKKKNERKLKKHMQTIKRAEKAERFQKQGELLTAHLHLVNQGDQSITVIDYYDPEQNELTIQLDPQLSPSENAQHYFKQYQKLKKSKQIITKEIKRTKNEIAYFEQLLQQIEVANEIDIDDIYEELQDEGYLKKRRTKSKKKQQKPKLEQYVSTDGTLILVGKNNKQNEYLTHRVARASDIWLHTKDIPGSHVVIRHSMPKEQTILEAAQIAAYFSKAQQSSNVPVDYTEIRHVKKPRGAKPGFVIYDQQKSVYVTPDEQVIRRLRKK